MKKCLSPLCIFLKLNYLYCDVFILNHAEILRPLINRSTGECTISGELC
ncbi:DUF6326 family protein [Teredinibacter turnerae]